MKLASFRQGEGPVRVGALVDDATLVDLAQAEQIADGAASGRFASMQALIEGGAAALDQARHLLDLAPDAALLQLADVRLLSPLPVPVRMRDAGMFIEHLAIIRKKMAAMAAEKSDDPSVTAETLLQTDQFRLPDVLARRVCYYNGNHLAVIGPGDVLRWPAGVEVIDYELELAVVIGRGGSDISPEAARDHVFGYTLMNDWSARDIQVETGRAGGGPCMGKDFGTSLGPWIVTADEIPDPQALEMTAAVNGEVWSRGWTRNMHHKVFDAVSELSRLAPLHAGEVIGSGTPAHGSASEQGKVLLPGQVVELNVPEIGTLANEIGPKSA